MTAEDADAGLVTHVLLVEDNPDDAEYVRDLLAQPSRQRFAVQVAGSLAEAGECLAREPFHVALVDLSLPDSFGLATLSALLARSPDLPIVITTGQAEESLGLEAVRRGAQDYLVKGQWSVPLVTRSLLYAIERQGVRALLRRREEHLRQLTAQLPAVLWTTDPQLRLTSLGGAGWPGFEGPPEALLGREISALFGDATESPAVPAHREALAGRSSPFETRWTGHLFHALAEPLRDPAGRIIGAVGLAVDITEQRRLEQEFHLARKIQQTLLPQSQPEIPGLELAGACYPASATGGDFYDFFRLADGAWAILIGDASGHGVGPALITASARAYLRALAQSHADLAVILRQTNALLLHDIPEEQYLTLLALKYDDRTGQLWSCNAGHPTGLLFDRDGRRTHRLTSSGPPLGWYADYDLAPAVEIPFQPGDLLFLFTDGVVEALTPQRTLFGIDRLLDLLSRQVRWPVEQLADGVCQAARAHSLPNPPQDDITAVALRRHPLPPTAP